MYGTIGPGSEFDLTEISVLVRQRVKIGIEVHTIRFMHHYSMKKN